MGYYPRNVISWVGLSCKKCKNIRCLFVSNLGKRQPKRVFKLNMNANCPANGRNGENQIRYGVNSSRRRRAKKIEIKYSLTLNRISRPAAISIHFIIYFALPRGPSNVYPSRPFTCYYIGFHFNSIMLPKFGPFCSNNLISHLPLYRS